MEIAAARPGGVLAARIDELDRRAAILNEAIANGALIVGLHLNFRFADGHETGLDLGDLGPLDTQTAINQSIGIIQALRDALAAQLAAL